MDVVIPLGRGSRWQDNELGICLRAIETNLTNYRHIWIVGEYPKWLQNCYHIPMHDSQKLVPDKNIMLKVKAACTTLEISDRFLFMNDDHFLLTKFNAESFPNYYDRTLPEAYHFRGPSPYGYRIKNTYEHLLSIGKPVNHFDIHYPIIYQKDLFIERVVNAVDWDNDRYGFIIKSLYANHELQSEKLHDCKSSEIPRNGWTCYSTMPHLSEGVKKWLFKAFPNKSRYEK